MENAVLDRCEEFRDRSQNAQGVTYTQLARGKEWRATLSKEGVLRVTGSRAGSEDAWLVSQRYMDSFLSLVEQAGLAQENEQASAMLAARKDYQNWMEGTDLAQTAASRYLQQRDSMREAVDAGQR